MDIVLYVVELALLLYLASATIFLLRVIRGPTIFDRIVAVDALSYDLTVFMGLIAFYTGRPLAATPMILVSLWSYALDVYISKSIEYREMGG